MMAEIAQPCNCSPYEYKCCGSCHGITVVQPKCQTLLDGNTINNPAFMPTTNTSYWTFKILIDCLCSTKLIDAFKIPICKNIAQNQIKVYEKIDNCGVFESVSFTLHAANMSNGCFDNFQWIKIDINDRYKKGVEAVYLIEIVGDYPVSKKPVKIKTDHCSFFFGCKKCFCVPGCWKQGQLSLTKKCDLVISDNHATLFYDIHLVNIGNTVLENVYFLDNLYIPVQLTPGFIKVEPPTLDVDTNIPGQIKISGNFDPIDPGAGINISYEIPIIAVSQSGLFTINNTASASAEGTEVSDNCVLSLPVVKLRAEKFCRVYDNIGAFTFLLFNENNAPDVTVDILDYVSIPSGVIIKFSDFNGCKAYYSGSQTPIPTNVPLSGPFGIDLICENVLIQSNSIYGKELTYELVSSSLIGETKIVNTLTEVVPTNPSEQIFLGVDALPASASINIHLNQLCQ